MKILITGGAGYIGSHVALHAAAAGHEPVVVDNLSTGHAWAVLTGTLEQGDLNDGAWLDGVFARHPVAAVLHFAAHTVVPESVRDPLRFYRNNTAGTLTLLEACRRHGVDRFVFSSTAAVYGMPELPMVQETTPCAPINPYGHTKLMSEQMLRDLEAACGLRHVVLRYFNVAGADPEGRLGQATPEASHLIKVACEAVVGRRAGLTIFGTDYDTPDGTCIRDYIHVDDLARAHILALTHLLEGGPSQVFNCGYGHGYSVREVVDAVRRVAGVDFPIQLGPRRPGDSPHLVADSTRIRQVLGWTPRWDDLNQIVASALAWERRLGPDGPRPVD